MTTHPVAQEIADYVRGTLPPDDLLRIDDHLATCAECRARATGPDAVNAAIAPLREALLPESGTLEHLSYEQIEGYVDGRLDDRARAAVEAHVETCASCAEDLQDLRSALAPRSTRTFFRWAGLAAAGIAAGVVGWFVLNAGREVVARPAEAPLTAARPPAPSVDPADAAALAEALRTGRLPIPDDIQALRGRTGTLMAERGAPSGFRPLQPIGTAVATPQPAFAWTAAEGDAIYTVSVFTVALDKVAESEPQRETTWSPRASLKAGETYLWQVRATSGRREMLAPIPPAPEARFQVVDSETAREVAVLRERYARSPLVLAVVLARAGLVDDARAALEMVERATPEAADARRLLASLDTPPSNGATTRRR